MSAYRVLGRLASADMPCRRPEESQLKDKKSEAELRETKSFKSLANWGHDMTK